MIRLLLSILITFTLTACASQAKLAKTIEENEWTTLKCSGFLTWHDCRQQGLALCPNGYLMINQFENITIQRREVDIACKQ